MHIRKLKFKLAIAFNVNCCAAGSNGVLLIHDIVLFCGANLRTESLDGTRIQA